MKGTLSKRVLALDLHSSSFGFAVFDGPDDLIDWGIKSFLHGSKAVKVPMPQKLAKLINYHEPEIIVIRAPKTTTAQKRANVVERLTRRRIKIRTIPDAVIRGAFPQQSRNKYQIATAIAELFPELSPRLGARRKVWQSEKYSMSIFDAAAIALSYFSTQPGCGKSRDETSSPLPH